MKNDELITELGFRLIAETDSYKRGDFHQAMLDIAYDAWNQHNDAVPHEVVSGFGPTRNVLFEGTLGEVKEWFDKRHADNDPILTTARTEQKKGFECWSYTEMLDHARANFGELVWALTLAGKYNQQVGNGGHIQYFDNGYASEGGGCFGQHDPDIPLHAELIGAMYDTIMPLAQDREKEMMAAALEVMRGFFIEVDDEKETEEECTVCGGSGHPSDNSDEGCTECGGTGQVTVDNDEFGTVSNRDFLDRLDDRWYAVEDEFIYVSHMIALRAIARKLPRAFEIDKGRNAFEAALKAAIEDGEFTAMIPPSDLVGKEGAACFVLLMNDNTKYGYIEQLDTVDGFRRSPVWHVNVELPGRLRDAPEGTEFRYWQDIADAYDAFDGNDQTRDDVREAYEKILDDAVEAGRLALKKDEDGLDNIYVRTGKK